ncbi:hypothetical protein DPMN_027227 [Dreissena polymorpha]|uniref:Uncharacterized protein n=1 Tax=Dreissena polymorpha TaxID=45954 RepID=A0A9D4RD98_DREPO|nr:hypothetical protein DPMN_027227 [Dreissena polymorpha]
MMKLDQDVCLDNILVKFDIWETLNEPTPLRYPFVHLGGEELLWDKFLDQGNSSGQGGIRARDLSIPKPASYH